MAIQGSDDHTHTSMRLGPPGALPEEQGPDLERSGSTVRKPAAVGHGWRQARPDTEESPLSWEPEARRSSFNARHLALKKPTEETDPFPVACFLS